MSIGKDYPYNVINGFNHNGTHSFLLEHIHKCKSGEIVVGREIIQELDIIIEQFSDPAIQIDLEPAHKRIKFIETKCKHSEAPYAGKPFILELFQKAFIESIYIFFIFDEELKRWVRLVQDVLFLVGRKNGKTPLVSALCLAEFFCGPMGLKILCSSNDYDQAGLMFDAINAMREESPALERVTRKNIKGIYFGNPKKPKKKGKFSYRNKGNIRKISAKTGAKEGKNIGVGAVDEGHELKDNTSIMPIRQALSTQDEPLYFELSTEGFVNDGYLDGRLKEARQVLDGELDRTRWRIWLYTQDSETEIWQDEKTWVKSNPGLGTIKKWSFLRGMVEEAKTSKATRAFVLAKDFNVKQNNSEAWLLEHEYINEETYNLEEFRGCIGLGAVDLSETTDLANAKVLIMRPGNPKKYILTKYFIPETKIEQGEKEDKKNYLEWAREGLIEVCKGNENDYSLITAWFVSLYKQYGIKVFKTGYDNWNAKYWIKEMEDIGFDTERVAMDKNTLSNPMKLVEADLKSKLINYNNNPIDRWCLGNTAMKIDNLGLIMPVKVNDLKNRRIDGAVTLIILYCIYMRYRTEYLEIVR
ncbi:MAG: terminase [Peptococcaceae bacterium BICA1-7]|nr:MAG: terminase [Peptococcaceae bacterium BICA1-7]HBV97769.1 terminase [Desulfotomaculum sp.]